MKKLLLLLTLFAGGLFGAGCDNDEQLQGHYNYEATVLYKGVDCHDTYLISLKNLDESSDITEGIYYADNLAPEFKVDGLKIYLNCQPLREMLLPIFCKPLLAGHKRELFQAC